MKYCLWKGPYVFYSAEKRSKEESIFVPVQGCPRTAFILCDPLTLNAFTGTPQILVKKKTKGGGVEKNTGQCF